MSSTKVWLLKYVAGNPAMFSRVRSSADNPMTRSQAMEGFRTITRDSPGWRVWVERDGDESDRVAESDAEKQWKEEN